MGAVVVPMLGALTAAILLPHFYLSVGRAADALRGDGKTSLHTAFVWASCLVPLWSFVMIPVVVARLGAIVGASADAPELPRRMVRLAWLQGICTAVGPMAASILVGAFAGLVVQSLCGTFLFALGSHFLIKAIDDVVGERQVPVMGGVGNDEPVAVKSV